MKIKPILLATFFVFLTSCGQKTIPIEDCKSAEEYLKQFSSKSVSEIKNNTEKDRIFIDSLGKYIDLEIKQSSLIINEHSSEVSKSVPKYQISQNDRIEKEFYNYVNKLFFEQVYLEKESVFYFESTAYIEDDVKDNLEHKVEVKSREYFFNGTKTKKIGFKHPDSIIGVAEYVFPTKLTELTLKTDSVYKTKNGIKFIRKDRVVTFELPLNVYKNFLKIQGFNKQGFRMNRLGKSSFPIFKINPKIVSNLTQLKKILNSENINQEIKRITDSQIKDVQQLVLLKNDIKKLKNHADLFNLIKRFEEVFYYDYQLLEVEFPDNVEEVELFLTNKRGAFSKKVIIKDSECYTDVNPYFVTENNHIIDKNGKIFKNDTAIRKYRLGKFFIDLDSDKGYQFKTNKLEPFSKDIGNYYFTLSSNYDIFKNDKFLITNNLKKVEKPFKDSDKSEFKRIGKHNDFIVVRFDSGEKRIYNKNLERIFPNKEIKRIDYLTSNNGNCSESYPFSSITDSNSKKALVDEKFNLLTPFKWDYIENVDRVYFICGKNRKYGLLNSKGKVTVPCNFENIKISFWDDDIHYKLNNKENTMKLEQFIKKFGK